MRKAILKMPTEFSPLPIYESLTLNLTHLLNKGINSIKVHFLFVSLISLFFAISLKCIKIGRLFCIIGLKCITIGRLLPIVVLKCIIIRRLLPIIVLKYITIRRLLSIVVLKYITIGRLLIKKGLKCFVYSLMRFLQYLLGFQTILMFTKFNYFTR